MQVQCERHLANLLFRTACPFVCHTLRHVSRRHQNSRGPFRTKSGSEASFLFRFFRSESFTILYNPLQSFTLLCSPFPWEERSVCVTFSDTASPLMRYFDTAFDAIFWRSVLIQCLAQCLTWYFNTVLLQAVLSQGSEAFLPQDQIQDP